jgi:putative Ca2+/H+ antiporter (TMEM165/GDT1 family)
MRAFWLSLGLTFWAEMGDRTQFVALAYATRHRLRDVLIGITLAVAAILLISVICGRLIGEWLSQGYVDALSAVCFLGFAAWTLRGEDENEEIREDPRHPIMIIATTFFLAELGDKTMFSTAALAATHSWFPVWVGSTAGMVLSDGLAVWVGRSLGKKIPEKIVRWIAAGFFFLFGVWYAYQAVVAFRPPSP